MMTFSAFIDPDYVKNNVPMGKNIDEDEFLPFIKEAQSVYIQDLIGTPLYEDLMEKTIMTGTASITTSPYLSTYERWLYELLSKSQAYRVVQLAAFHITYKLRNAGLVQAQAQYTQNLSLKEIDALEQRMENLANHYADRAKKFLCENSDQFPLYTAASEDMYPNSYNDVDDVYFPDDYSGGTKYMTYNEFVSRYLS